MADPLPTAKGFLELAWANALPLLIGIVVGAVGGRLLGALFGL